MAESERCCRQFYRQWGYDGLKIQLKLDSLLLFQAQEQYCSCSCFYKIFFLYNKQDVFIQNCFSLILDVWDCSRFEM